MAYRDPELQPKENGRKVANVDIDCIGYWFCYWLRDKA